jgi:hypothetical protein
VNEAMPGASDPLSRLDTTVAHSARLWNYLLGGKDNFAVDREAAQPDRTEALLRQIARELNN